jgi:predicted acylesterase/phospholipase RssA
MKVVFAALLTVFASALHSIDGKCRILALKGGGVHGAYEVGVLKALIRNQPAN